MTEDVAHTDITGLQIVVGPSGKDQEGSFMNGTLQDNPEYTVSYTIQTFIKMPERLDVDGVANLLAAYLGSVVTMTNGAITFDVQVGPHDEPEDDDEEEDDEC